MANNFFAGFDRSTYPGDPLMTAIIQNTNLCWCGFYLGPAPSHPDTSWMKQRAFLKGLGFGLAPLYVGQQVTGPGSHNVTAAQGKIDAQQAASLASLAGFPAGSIIFLDIEQGPPPDPKTIVYYRAWVEEFATNTKYAPGVYCSYSKVAAALFKADSRPVFWVFNINKFTCIPSQVTATRVLIPHNPPFPDPDPAQSGVAFAQLWQLAQGTECAINAGALALRNIDFDTSVARDPSNPSSYPLPVPAPAPRPPVPAPVAPQRVPSPPHERPPFPPPTPMPQPSPSPTAPQRVPSAPPVRPPVTPVTPPPVPAAPFLPPQPPPWIPPVQAPTPVPWTAYGGCSCACCVAIAGMVSLVATTATTSITAITAIAKMGRSSHGT